MGLEKVVRLMVVTDAALLKGRDPVDVCRRAVQGGATTVQVRWKDGSPRDTVALAGALVVAVPVPVLVNDRVDLALAAGAAGAHLGWEDVPLERLRPHVPPGFVLGLSVGSTDEAGRARRTSADYWSVGPCFATGTKPDAGTPVGPEGFASLARLAPEGVPVIGIGGVTAENAGLLTAAGAAGVAVISAVLAAPDPERATASLVQALGPSSGPKP